MIKINKILEKLMLEHGKYSEYELARHTGISQSTINRIISGNVELPNQSSLKKLSDFFHVTPEQLLGEEPIDKVKIFDCPRESALKETLSKLMEIFRVSEQELSNQTNVAQSTINRILNGQTSNPRGGSLRPIAVFFGVTIPQLFGVEPIDFLKISNNNLLEKIGLKKLPIIHFEKLSHLDEILLDKNSQMLFNTILIQSDGTKNIFATVIPDNLHIAEFEPGTIMIVDRSAHPSDGSYIILEYQGKIILKEISIIGQKYFIQSAKTEAGHEQLVHDFKIIGVVIEVRKSFDRI